MLKTLLKEKLADETAFKEGSSKELADFIKQKVKGILAPFLLLLYSLGCLMAVPTEATASAPRYKYLVQVVTGENKGQGVK